MKRLLLVFSLVLVAASLPGRADLLRDAAGGDSGALHKVFQESLRAQGSTSAVYGRQLRQILESTGNARFTRALMSEPPGVRNRVMYFLNIAMSSH